MKPGAFDEMGGFGEGCRPCYAALKRWLDDAPPDLLDQRRKEAELLFRRIGITFAVYGEQAAQERLIPFDIIPRVIAGEEWGKLSLGLEQRVKALNAFLKDVYGSREIVRAGVVPEELILCNPYFRPEMAQLRLVGDIYVAIAGIDVVRVDADTFYVLEDNARTPSGVSYMLENREAMIRLFPELFARQSIAPVDGYPDELLATLHSIAPRRGEEPCVVLLTPGPYNSAYYEHSFLADKLGIELVEGRDLFVRDETVFMRTTQGPKRVDVIYSRIDDDFLDPLAFRPDSVLGVPGLMLAYRAGNVSLANAVGTGVADDKAVYAYMPRTIKYYLGEDAILPNVETHICREPEGLAYTLAHLAELVVKPVGEAGGYGITIGPRASARELEKCRAELLADPANYIAQPMVNLSVCPTVTEEGVQARHVDLRPFAVTGKSTWVLPGGLSRVALVKGSIIVNSSQGGGSKDTWVLE